MIDRYWNQHGPRTLWLALIGGAAVVAIVAARGFFVGRSLEERVTAVADRLRPAAAAAEDNAGQNAPPPGPHGMPGMHGGAAPGENPNDPAAAAAARIQQRFLFMPAPPQGFRNVMGVLGDRVLYPGGQSFGLGDNAMGATVVAIGSNWVELEHEGQSITLDIFPGTQRGPEQLRWQPPEAPEADIPAGPESALADNAAPPNTDSTGEGETDAASDTPVEAEAAPDTTTPTEEQAVPAAATTPQAS